METSASPSKIPNWLLQNGPEFLASLFRAITGDASMAARFADSDETHRLHKVQDGEPRHQQYALYLLDMDGCVAAWYSSATDLYGYAAAEILGKHVSVVQGGLNLTGDHFSYAKSRDDLARAATEGHFGVEGRQKRRDGSYFWANTITMPVRDQLGGLQGFAGIVRDFSERHDRDEKERHGRARLKSNRVETPAAGIVSGEYQRISEVNDAFLEIVGYSREDFTGAMLHWAALTPSEYLDADQRAQEEALLFGASVPFEKQLIKRDGTRVAVLVVTAVLNLVPFRWLSVVQDLTDRNRFESVEEVGVAEAGTESGFDEMVGNSAALKRILHQVEVVAPTDATVLILGETGTGKELVARAIHRMSPRRNMPCITLNCAAIPTGLLESELFGYERGAFTGALSQKIGRFEMAHRGTLFLDEVGDIPLDLQPKLLRALQEKSFERLGGTRTIPIDVRLVAATNRNLAQMIGDKLFRSDLYYRLKVFPITTPPLRDRPEDIPILVRHFVQKYSAKMGRNIDKVPLETIKALVHWSWPGNIRELENFIERAVILSNGPSLRAPLAEIKQDAAASVDDSTLEHIERNHILRIFRESGGVVTLTATRLGLHRTTLNAIMRKLGISRHDL